MEDRFITQRASPQKYKVEIPKFTQNSQTPASQGSMDYHFFDSRDPGSSESSPKPIELTLFGHAAPLATRIKFACQFYCGSFVLTGRGLCLSDVASGNLETNTFHWGFDFGFSFLFSFLPAAIVFVCPDIRDKLCSAWP